MGCETEADNTTSKSGRRFIRIGACWIRCLVFACVLQPIHGMGLGSVRSSRKSANSGASCWTWGRSFARCCVGRSALNNSCWAGDSAYFYSKCCTEGPHDDYCVDLIASRLEKVRDRMTGLDMLDMCCSVMRHDACWPDRLEVVGSTTIDSFELTTDFSASFARCCLPRLNESLHDEAPDWMQKAVDADIARAWDVPEIRIHQPSYLSNFTASLNRSLTDADYFVHYHIESGQLRVETHSEQGFLHYAHVHWALARGFHLLKFHGARLPNMSFCVHDDEAWRGLQNPELSGCKGLPVFVNNRISHLSAGTALLPMWHYFTDWVRRVGFNVLHGRRHMPQYRDLKPILFWRGTDSDSYIRYPERGADARPPLRLAKNWFEFPRGRIVLLSMLHPSKIDARYTRLLRKQCADCETLFNMMGLKVDWVGDVESQLRYKYMIDLDGSAESMRLFWSLQAPGIVFKHQTPIQSWFNGMLIPWVHYIPVKEDLSDLVERIQWAELHPEECMRISNAATEFAVQRLSLQVALNYLYRLLLAHARRQKMMSIGF